MTTIDDYRSEIRNNWIEKAKKETAFIDAVFLIAYYNWEVKTVGPTPWSPDIKPSEVFEDFDETEYKTCYERAFSLLTKTAYVGESHWNYKRAAPYKKAVSRMKSEHPGFSNENYQLAAARAASAMKW